MQVPFSGAHRIAAVVAAIHIAGVLVTAASQQSLENHSGQAVLVWVPWAFIDLPVSFLAYVSLDAPPWVVHGLVGTLWWYFLALVVITGVRRRKRRPNTLLERTSER
jgi:uncharacterized protein (DUF2062 family)